jgi:hypothetical protein
MYLTSLGFTLEYLSPKHVYISFQNIYLTTEFEICLRGNVILLGDLLN